jgi:hypothetical protein
MNNTHPPVRDENMGEPSSEAYPVSASQCSNESYLELSLPGALEDPRRDGDCDWELASTGTAGETGPGGNNMVPHGTIGHEYRTMKAARAAEMALPRGGTPIRDPYHGKTMEPR